MYVIKDHHKMYIITYPYTRTCFKLKDTQFRNLLNFQFKFSSGYFTIYFIY